MDRIVFAVLATALFAGCQTARPLYHWGSYEALIYQGYANPQKAPPELQIEKLEEDLQKAAAAHEAVPPGVHAHLGYLHTQLGHAELAAKHFETEKRLFPESAVFIDTMLKKPAPAGAAPTSTPVTP